jgi:hypothetical protein
LLSDQEATGFVRKETEYRGRLVTFFSLLLSFFLVRGDRQRRIFCKVKDRSRWIKLVVIKSPRPFARMRGQQKNN